MNCKYCEQYESLEYFYEENEEELTEFGEGTICVVDGRLSYEFATDMFYKDGSVKINYCPMCGRKLEEEAE